MNLLELAVRYPQRAEGGVPDWMLGHFRRCLLYTSPSPRDRQKSRMPSSA